MDADVRLKAGRIETITLPMDDMDAHLLIDDGEVHARVGLRLGELRGTRCGGRHERSREGGEKQAAHAARQ